MAQKIAKNFMFGFIFSRKGGVHGMIINPIGNNFAYKATSSSIKEAEEKKSHFGKSIGALAVGYFAKEKVDNFMPSVFYAPCLYLGYFNFCNNLYNFDFCRDRFFSRVRGVSPNFFPRKR